MVLYENNVVCKDEALNRALSALLPDDAAGGENTLWVARLHTEAADGERADLTGWKERARTLHWDNGLTGCNYSLVHYERTPDTSLCLSVVISTCNQPAWLEKVLWGYEAQTEKRFELIVADDGSRKETFDLLQRLTPRLSYPVKHVWHEDKGFRKCDILNKSILAAQTDYLLFSDGDCIPRRDFVETHLRLRRRGRFLSGGYHKLDTSLSRSLTVDDILSGRCFDQRWMRAHGMPASFKNNKLTATGFKRWALNTFTPTKATWNGHNASGWLDDILAVNGFDERMQYGGQDREFGERLENYGIHGMQIRYSTVCLHLDHPRGYKTEASIRKNREIRRHTRGQKVLWSPYGICKEPLAGVMAKANRLYDRYTREEEQLAHYRRKGWMHGWLVSLPCQWRRRSCRSGVLAESRRQAQMPVLPGHPGVVVSLTSFPARIGQLHLTLKSLLWQTWLPERIVVWLSKEEFPRQKDELPGELLAMEANGVEFRFVPGNLRSHKKYYYAFREYPDQTVITVDDDLIYPRRTLERLLLLSYRHPGAICANIIRQIVTDKGSFVPYKRWEKPIEMPENCSLRNVGIGCGGICYPPRWYGDELFDAQLIASCCPAADDLWLKANQLKHGVSVAGGGTFFPRPIELPGTVRSSLQRANNGRQSLNDWQWGALNRLWQLGDEFGSRASEP